MVFGISIFGILTVLFLGLIKWSVSFFPNHPLVVVGVWFAIPAAITGAILTYLLNQEDVEEEVLEIDDDEFV